MKFRSKQLKNDFESISSAESQLESIDERSQEGGPLQSMARQSTNEELLQLMTQSSQTTTEEFLQRKQFILARDLSKQMGEYSLRESQSKSRLADSHNAPELARSAKNIFSVLHHPMRREYTEYDVGPRYDEEGDLVKYSIVGGLDWYARYQQHLKHHRRPSNLLKKSSEGDRKRTSDKNYDQKPGGHGTKAGRHALQQAAIKIKAKLTIDQPEQSRHESISSKSSRLHSAQRQQRSLNPQPEHQYDIYTIKEVEGHMQKVRDR